MASGVFLPRVIPPAAKWLAGLAEDEAESWFPPLMRISSKESMRVGGVRGV
jgi:hypothetical protein